MISEGDYVEVNGKFKGGVLNAQSVHNVTTESTVTPKRVSRALVAVGAVFVIAIFLFVFGLFGYMFVTQSGIWDQLPFNIVSQSPIASQSSKLAISAQYVGDLTQVGGFSAKPGMKYVEYSATVSNLNAKNRPMEPENFKIKGMNGNVYSLDQTTHFAANGMDTVTSSQPGDNLSGNVIFNVPQDFVPQSMIYQDMWDTATCSV
ncbi:MAG: DUF4352 domain-containing protein [Terracidiphilus sp.]